MSAPWLSVRRYDEPLLVSFPHTGTEIPADCAKNLVSLKLVRHDTDWFIDQLYAFAADLGATIVRTALSRSVIDVNRDPSGASLYPGQVTTGLVPTETFDGRPLYHAAAAPTADEIERRRRLYFAPYHAALSDELARLQSKHRRIVLFDCHSIRSLVPRLFTGELPMFNIGTNSGESCASPLAAEVASLCAASGHTHVVDGRFKGGWITRHYGSPGIGIHAIQMELAMRGYVPNEATPRWDANFAKPMQLTLRRVLTACRNFANA